MLRIRWKSLAACGLLGAALLAPAPGQAQFDWNQAYGNLGNTSFVNVQTQIGVSPLWSFRLDGPVEWGGPALGPDGTIYLGTTNGRLQAIRPDGTPRCTAAFPSAAFTSTPAVLANGNVAVLFQRKTGEVEQGEMALLSADCKVLWNRELPKWSPEIASVSSGSVKVWKPASSMSSFLFVHTRRTRQMDVTVPRADTANELLVFSEEGQLFARQAVGQGCVRVHGGAIDWGGLFGDVWDYVWPSAGSVPPLYEQFGWPDSTPAILDSTIRGFASPSQPLVAVTDDACDPELITFQFRPGAAMPDRLRETWRKRLDNTEGTKLSSPAVLPEGNIVVGSSTHRLRFYHLPTQRLVWEVDTGDPVMHPPSIAPGILFTLTELTGWLYDLNGNVIPTGRVQPMYPGGTLAASAASLTQAFIPSFKGLDVWWHDLYHMAHPLRDQDIVTSNPIVSPGGRVYVVGQKEAQGVLFAFGPP